MGSEQDKNNELNRYQPIDCSDYDFIELACMDKYQVDVSTTRGRVSGIATDVKIREGGEFFMVKNAGGEQSAIRIDTIEKITVLSEPRRFDEWVFKRPTQSN